MSPEIGRIVLVIGLVLVVIGGLAVLGVRLPFGRLPGDIAIEGENGGIYIPLGSTMPIFVGSLIRWIADKIRGVSASEAETETSPGVLLASGYIAGGTLCSLVIAFFAFMPEQFNEAIDGVLAQRYAPYSAAGVIAIAPRFIFKAHFTQVISMLLSADLTVTYLNYGETVQTATARWIPRPSVSAGLMFAF